MFFQQRSNKNSDDAQLIRKYQETGKLRVLGELYEHYMPLVYGVCLKYLKHKEDSQDAVMQIFEVLVDRLRTEEVRQFKPWLYVVTRNYCLMQLRKAKIHHIPLNGQSEEAGEEDNNLSEATLSEVTLSEATLSEAQWQLLEQGMDRLPAEQQRCLQLFYWQQQSYQAIAEQTGYDLKQVKSHIQNGRRNLKLFVEKNHE